MAGKLLKGTMDVRKIVLLFVLMISVSSFFVSSGRQLHNSDSLEETVKEVSLDCGLDPASTSAYIEANYKRKQAFSRSSPELKYLLDCLRKHRIFSKASREDNPRNSYSEYLSTFTNSRRHLGDQPRLTPMPAPARAPILAPTPSSSPSLTPKPSPSPSPLPAHAHTSNLSPQPNARDAFLNEIPLISEEPISGNAADVRPEKQDNNKNAVVIAVVITAVVVTVFACLLICCCRCLRGTRRQTNGYKDESPLLAVSMSDFSGSSSYGYGGSVQKDKIGSSSVKIESHLNGHVTFLGSTGEYLASESSNASLPPLKPPPGRNLSSLTPAPAPSTALATVPPTSPPPAPQPASPSAQPPPGPPLPPKPKTAPPPPGPPPPPKPSAPPRPPPISSSNMKGPRQNRPYDEVDDARAPKTKLKPLFWDKVSTNPDTSMVWNEIKSGSFQFNEEMIETLFGYGTDGRQKNTDNKKTSVFNEPSQFIQLLEPKKSQNLAITLKAMNIKVDEISDALMEGNELPQELLQILLKMAPTTDEELKLRLYSGDTSLLGPGEQFLKVIIEIPFAFQRMDALLLMTSLSEEVTNLKESFASLEVACKELRNSRLFLKLLEAVLKLGNRMNDGTYRGGAQAFKLDTLLKLADVKGTDGKTTLLHFVVQEIIRSEGARAVRLARENQNNSMLTLDNLTGDSFEDTEDHYQALGLEIVSRLSTELENVKRAAGMDADALTNTVANYGNELLKTKGFLDKEMKSIEEESEFHRSLKSFVERAEADITLLLEEEKRIRLLLKNTTDYFNGNSVRDEGLRMFVIVRDFLAMIDKVCKDVQESQKRVVKTQRCMDNPELVRVSDQRQQLFPAIRDRRVDSSSSSDDD